MGYEPKPTVGERQRSGTRCQVMTKKMSKIEVMSLGSSAV